MEGNTLYLERASLKHTNSGGIFYDLISKRHVICNKDLMRILEKCDGTKTIEGIAEGISSEKDVFQKTQEMITKLGGEGLVKFTDHKREHKPRIINENCSTYPIDSVFLEATKRCNLSCVHCYNPQSETEELRTDEIFDFISDIERLGVLKMRITGGEPFMRRDLMYLLEKTNSSNIDFSIFTNGILIKKQQIKRLADLNPEFVAISVDSVNSDQYRRIRGVDNKNVLRNLEVMLEEGIRTRANVVLFKDVNDSYSSIKNTLQYLANLGMGRDDVVFDEVVPEGRGTGIPTYDLKEKRDVMERLSELYGEVFGEEMLIKTPEGHKKEIGSYCGLGESFFYLGSNGSVSLCPMLNFGEYIIGNIREDPIKKIWENASLLNHFREKKHLENTTCSGCDYINLCAGGCKAKSLFFKGAINEPDPWMCAHFLKDQIS